MNAVIDVIHQHRAQLTELCRRYGVKRLDLFGSATRDDFDPKTSDLDFLVEFDEFSPLGAADQFLGLMVDLEDLFGRKIDLVVNRAIRNPYFREVVDRTRVQLYAA